MNEITTTTTITNKAISEPLGQIIIPSGNIDFVEFIPTKVYNSYLLTFDKAATITLIAEGSIISGEALNPTGIGISVDITVVVCPINPNIIKLKIPYSTIAEDITIKIYGLDSEYNSSFFNVSLINYSNLINTSINTISSNLNNAVGTYFSYPTSIYQLIYDGNGEGITPINSLLKNLAMSNIVMFSSISFISSGTVRSNTTAFKGLKVTNTNNTYCYFQVFDVSGIPFAGSESSIIDITVIPPNSTINIGEEYYKNGILCNLGLSWIASSSPTTIVPLDDGTVISTLCYSTLLI